MAMRIFIVYFYVSLSITPPGQDLEYDYYSDTTNLYKTFRVYY